jgi:hypothetical protein
VDCKNASSTTKTDRKDEQVKGMGSAAQVNRACATNRVIVKL